MQSSNKTHWQFNLYQAMRDPSLIIYKDESIVIINDKHPKSDVHLLVLPLCIIQDSRFLTFEHYELLCHMETVTKRLIMSYPEHTFWWGFHAKPTMLQLHMHVISDDFRGVGMKTVKQWNSYTTSFFIPLSKAVQDLLIHGRVMLPSQPVCSQLLESEITCHKCGYKPVNMPTLKVHLLTHIPI